MRHSVYDNAGKPIRFQYKVPPAQAVAESLGDLTFQPVEIWKFMQDHSLKLIKKGRLDALTIGSTYSDSASTHAGFFTILCLGIRPNILNKELYSFQNTALVRCLFLYFLRVCFWQVVIVQQEITIYM